MREREGERVGERVGEGERGRGGAKIFYGYSPARRGALFHEVSHWSINLCQRHELAIGLHVVHHIAVNAPLASFTCSSVSELYCISEKRFRTCPGRQ